MTYIDHKAAMKLPEGKGCGDCYAYRYCSGTMKHVKPDTDTCDWYPRRFRERVKPLAGEE